MSSEYHPDKADQLLSLRILLKTAFSHVLVAITKRLYVTLCIELDLVGYTALKTLNIAIQVRKFLLYEVP